MFLLSVIFRFVRNALLCAAVLFSIVVLPELGLSDEVDSLHFDVNTPESFCANARSYLFAGDTSAAIAEYDKLVALMPTSPAFLKKRIDCYFSARMFDSVVSDCSIVLERPQNDYLVRRMFYQIRGVAYCHLGRFDLAEFDLELASKTFLLTNVPAAYYRALIQIENGDSRKARYALIALTEHLYLAPRGRAFINEKIEEFKQIGVDSLLRAAFNSVIEEYAQMYGDSLIPMIIHEKLENLDPKYVGIVKLTKELNVDLLYSMFGEPYVTLGYYSVTPRDIYLLLESTYRIDDGLKWAEKQARLDMRRHGQNPAVWYVRARVYESANKRKKAIKYYDKVIEFTIDSPGPLAEMSQERLAVLNLLHSREIIEDLD